MKQKDAPSELLLKQFLFRELPKLSDVAVEDVIKQVAYARQQYTRYAKARNAAGGKFTYKSKKSSCRRILIKISELKSELQNADLMLLDELHDYIGSDQFQNEVTAYLERLSTACVALHKTIPTYVEHGRPVDRILYDWVLNMVRIFEDLFGSKKVDHRQNGKFLQFLRCWTPDAFPIHGGLSPRTIQRVLEFRKSYKEDLRNTFMPEYTYSPKVWGQ